MTLQQTIYAKLQYTKRVVDPTPALSTRRTTFQSIGAISKLATRRCAEKSLLYSLTLTCATGHRTSMNVCYSNTIRASLMRSNRRQASMKFTRWWKMISRLKKKWHFILTAFYFLRCSRVSRPAWGRPATSKLETRRLLRSPGSRPLSRTLSYNLQSATQQ